LPEDPPETCFTRSGDVSIAYQVLGDGPLDLVYVPAMAHHVELTWEVPPQAKFLRRLATLGRLHLFDKRGTGMSGRVGSLPTLEARMDDIRAVMDAADSERAAVIGIFDGGALAALFAATYPERTSALILIHPAPRFVRSPQLPWLPTRTEYERKGEEVLRHWGDRDWLARYYASWLPSATEGDLESYTRVVRYSLDPGSYSAYRRMNLDLDVSDVLPLIRVPTLVMSRTQVEQADIRTARYVAARIAGARLAELPGRDLGPGWGDPESVLAELEAFLAEVAEARQWQAVPDRVLATVLFTDLVGSTTRAVELGPHWGNVLGEHNAVIRRELIRFRGRAIDTAGDGFFASGFDGPARAIRCACAIRDAVTSLGLEVRVGVHTGECDLVDDKLSGLAVNVGARVAAQAEQGEVLVSGTVKDPSQAPGSRSNHAERES
jgi:pimeloyl-ACP methyl ester carboxylesterase